MENLLVLIGSFLAFFGIPALASIGVIAAIFLLCLVIYVIVTIPFYKMAKKAGIPNSWLVWIPYANVYILLQLTRREFNIFNWIRTYNRVQVFWCYLVVCLAAMPAIDIILGILGNIPVINILVGVSAPVVNLLYMVALQIFNWRVYYDILMTYGMKENAMLLSILSCFIPIVMIVWSYMVMDREPDYNC